jgi:hypothetical protein
LTKEWSAAAAGIELTMINQDAEQIRRRDVSLYRHARLPLRGDQELSCPARPDRNQGLLQRQSNGALPLINIEEANSEDVIRGIGDKLLAVFDKTYVCCLGQGCADGEHGGDHRSPEERPI